MSGDGFGPALCNNDKFRKRIADLSGNTGIIDAPDRDLISREFGVP